MVTTAFNGSNIVCGNVNVCPFTPLFESSLRTESTFESVHNLTDLKGYLADIAENWEISRTQTVVRQYSILWRQQFLTSYRESSCKINGSPNKHLLPK